MTPTPLHNVKALLFDVFGTCVDWRQGIAQQTATLAKAHGIKNIDWYAFADAWRSRYQPQMELVRSGQRPWAKLDVLHYESLITIWRQFNLPSLPDDAMNAFNRTWHYLEPWPDTVAGLVRLKSKFVIAPNSNAHIALLVDMAKHASLPWDAILGAETSQSYKTRPEAYLRNVAALDLEPGEVMMVAAHNNDLLAASQCGLKTGFIFRPTEYGPKQTTDLQPAKSYDLVAEDFGVLAEKLGC